MKATWLSGNIRQIVGVVIAGVLLILALSGTAEAATITVSNLNDSGTGSLRQAIADATPGDSINFAVTVP
jgi:hypothetical protein